MLSKVVTEYLEERLPGKFDRIEPTEENTAFLRIKPADPEFGDIDLYDDGDEVTIVFGRFTHSHYGNYEDKLKEEKELQIAQDVFEALNETLNDRYEFWGSHEGMGGFRVVEYTDGKKRSIISRLFFPATSKTFYRWSGAIRKISR